MGNESSVTVFRRTVEELLDVKFVSIVKTKPEPKPGVYAIFYKDQCVYIGQSENIKKRLATHGYREWFTKIRAGNVLWFEADDRISIEKALIETCRPLLNGRGSCHHYLAINEAMGTPVNATRFLNGGTGKTSKAELMKFFEDITKEDREENQT